MGLDHVAISVADLEAAERFYVDGLGFAVGETFTADDGTENVFVSGATGARIQLRSAPKRGAPAGPDHLAVAVGDVAEAVDRLVERTGCPVVRDPGPGHAASTIAFVEDPDGRRIELIEG